ncbi:gelsolin-like protein 2 isoform X2 [Convolutriloba macropyga]|uniref:gelsolin-like protein 2 isoform X2 n=1 Tax=Convolutriloba macropyga TaxID=536237 RepID=UPI003F524CD5
MNTYKNEGEEDFEYDIHFWIGNESTQDEYGTAAYKTVELDTLLEDKPVQHREVMENESEQFKGYFSSLTYLKGGVASGFKHVEKKEIAPRLFHFKSNKKQGSRKKEIKMRQIGLNWKNLDSGDVYILETQDVIYQWNGIGSDQTERYSAGQYVLQLREERLGKIKCEVIEDPDIDEVFMSFFSDADPVDEKFSTSENDTHVIKRLTDASGELKLVDVTVPDDKVSKTLLDSNDVFIVDKRNGACYVWFGKNASPGERKNWSIHAHNYLKDCSNPLKHVQTVKEGSEPEGFFD